MIRDLVYICGAPGAGKTTLMRHLRLPWDMEVVRQPPVPHVLLRSPGGILHGLELGVPREVHGGTDSLAMDISHRASEFLLRSPVGFALGEGARLATRPFLSRLAAAGVRVHLVHLDTPPVLLDERCAERGTTQNPAWRRGAATRALNLAAWALDDPHINYLELRSGRLEPGSLAEWITDHRGLEFLVPEGADA